jgi:hypothetical protein
MNGEVDIAIKGKPEDIHFESNTGQMGSSDKQRIHIDTHVTVEREGKTIKTLEDELDIRLERVRNTWTKGTQTGSFQTIYPEGQAITDEIVDEAFKTAPLSLLPPFETNTTDIVRKAIRRTLYKSRHLFMNKGGPLPAVRHFEIPIDTVDDKPVNAGFRRFAPEMRMEIIDEVSKLQKQGIIRPCKSDYASAVMMVMKPNGKWRFCIDLRALNRKILAYSFPLPTIQSVLDCLGGATVFSSVDATSAYFQLKIKEEDQKKTAFRVPTGSGKMPPEGANTQRNVVSDGLYCFNRLPMGLKISSPVFQQFVEHTFAGLSYKCLLGYQDDLLIFSQNAAQHAIDLEEVFDRLREHNLTINPEKSYFLKKISVT